MLNPVSASALGRNGIQDWILLRASAVVIAIYILYLFGYLALSGEQTYLSWHLFFTYTTTKLFTLLALLAVLIHLWIGMWQIFTDYVKNSMLRLLLQGLVVLVALLYFLYGAMLMWGM
ncbi:MAG: Succinate dehydrogenase hydrophobic membrane anchor subunit [Candidatus Erwinia impunctatus]|nr:Succinate dehydrogenase hydrophobic membrane anchor subunit [Culicoides impunctatus]